MTAMTREYLWGRTLWKGLRPALVAGALMAVNVFVQGLSPEWLKELGIPVVVGVFIVEAVRNWWKTAPLRERW